MYIKGVGCTVFGIEQISEKLIYDATTEALDDADIGMGEIDAVIISNLNLTNNGDRQRLKASYISSLFQKKMPIIQIPAACGGGGASFWTGLNLLKGDFNNILVLGYEKIVANSSKVITDDILMAAEKYYEQTEGMNFPSQYALIAQQHMLKYGSTEDDFALIAEKNHNHAFLNPKARFFNKKVTLNEITKSPIVASPLRVFDCSISSNGAAAVVISKNKSDIKVKGSSHITDNLALFEREDLTSIEATKLAGNAAFEEAGIERSDVNLIEVHDAFTPAEIIAYEDLGFAKKGKGVNLIRSGKTNLDGKLPANLSGGLKAKGHPISATGLGQIYEIVKQLRNEAGDRQVECKYGLTHNSGGCGGSVSVHIMEKV